MEWLGRATIGFDTAPAPLELREKDGATTDLLRVCEGAVPPCNLNPLIFNGHAQTIWTTQNKAAPTVFYKRRMFQADHRWFAGQYAVDFASQPFDDEDPALPDHTKNFTPDELAAQGSDDTRPMLVVLHGLSGGSHEVYLKHAVAPIFDSGDWEVCVVTSRGCAKSKISTGILYNARATWDLRQTVKWLRKTYPNRPLFGMGFSLGACILTNYLGEEGSACELKAAVVLANPWNLEASSKSLRRTFFGTQVYQRALGSAMRSLSRAHKDEIQRFTDIDYDKLMQLTYLYEFDRAYQCPMWGYPTEEAYYRDASSVDSLLAVRIPTLCINAVDDPIAHHEALPYGEARQNPYTVLCTTSLGGHLGWFEIGGGRWHAKPVANFLNHMAFKVDLDSAKQANGSDAKLELGTVATSYDPMRRRMYVDLNAAP